MMTMPRPITHGEVGKHKLEAMPPEVIKAFNELIAKHWNGREATIMQKEVVELIKSKMNLDSATGCAIYENNWLDVEDIYRKAGWVVTYDKPGFNEMYDAAYEFKKKNN